MNRASASGDGSTGNPRRRAVPSWASPARPSTATVGPKGEPRPDGARSLLAVGQAGVCLRGKLKWAGIEKKNLLHKLRHADTTTARLGAGAELVDIQALLGHVNRATTQIYTNVGQARMEKVVGSTYKHLFRPDRCKTGRSRLALRVDDADDEMAWLCGPVDGGAFADIGIVDKPEQMPSIARADAGEFDSVLSAIADWIGHAGLRGRDARRMGTGIGASQIITGLCKGRWGLAAQAGESV